jgi:hypothetical protein
MAIVRGRKMRLLAENGENSRQRQAVYSQGGVSFTVGDYPPERRVKTVSDLP